MNDWMKDEIAYIRASLGDVYKSQESMRVDLERHILRTSLAEENIQMLRAEVRPISMHVAVITALVKLVGLVGGIVGLVVGVLKLAERVLQ